MDRTRTRGMPDVPPDTCNLVENWGDTSKALTLWRLAFESGPIFGYMALTFFGPAFQRVPPMSGLVTLLMRSTTPIVNNWVLGCSDFARRYFRKSL